MQLASYGMRGAKVAKNAPNIIQPSGARHMHVHAPARPQATVQSTSRRLVSQTRNVLSRFFAHLTTPGLHVQPAARSLHAGVVPTRMPTIQQRLPFTARATLGKPLGGGFHPRAPVVPRSVTQVGLGTARNFSSGRMVFQNLVENVPITGRALYETDWEIKGETARDVKKRMKKAEKENKRKEMMKPASEKIQVPVEKKKQVSSEEKKAHEFNRYFSQPANAGTTTYLLIPLAPTPTARLPLPPDSVDNPLLPLANLASLHYDHELHSLKVSTLFSRLDTANVWERGVQCSAYAHRTTMEGTCRILKVEFIGWTTAEVRSVIGESGSGWCALEEIRTEEEDVDDDLSETSSILSGILSGQSGASTPASYPEDVPSIEDSFVLPTLDFSSSFAESQRSSSCDDLLSLSESEMDAWSDGSIESMSSGSFIDPPSENGWFGFSSSFVNRALADSGEATNEPRELLF